MDAAWVCKKFKTSCRHEVLTFEHHRLVAALPAEEADEILDWAEMGEDGKPRTIREVRHRARQFKTKTGQRRLISTPAALPKLAQHVSKARLDDLIVRVEQIEDRLPPREASGRPAFPIVHDVPATLDLGADDIDFISARGRLSCMAHQTQQPVGRIR
jgi:hypothetical protein